MDKLKEQIHGYFEVISDRKPLVFISFLLNFLSLGTLIIVFFQDSNENTSISLIVGAVTNILVGVITGIVFSNLDRNSLLTPIVKQSSKINEDVSKNILIFNEIARDIDEKIGDMADYRKYSVARQDFGLNETRGLVRRIGSVGVNSEFDREDVIQNLIRTASPGSIISQMISYVEDHNNLINSIVSATNIGVNIRLLILDSRVDSEALKARYQDIAHLGRYNGLDHFAAILSGINEQLKNVERQLKENEKFILESSEILRFVSLVNLLIFR